MKPRTLLAGSSLCVAAILLLCGCETSSTASQAAAAPGTTQEGSLLPKTVTPNPDLAPTLVKRVNAALTSDLEETGVTGYTMVEFVINEEGKVENAQTVRTSHPDLAPLALAAIQQWEFTPAEKDGAPVPVRGTHRFEFN